MPFRLPLLGDIDERFLVHRQRSTSYAGMAGAVGIGALYFYRYFHDHHLDLGLLGVLAAMVFVKFALLAYYRLND